MALSLTASHLAMLFVHGCGATRNSMKPTAAEKRFQLWVMEKPCCVPDCNQPSIFHHEKQPYPLPRRDHMFGVNICDPHHRELHVIFSWVWEKFKKAYGVWLPDIAKQNREEYGKLDRKL